MGTTPPTHACAVRFMNFGAETKFEKGASDRNSPPGGNLVMYRLPHEKKNYGFTPNLDFNPLPTRFNLTDFLPPSGEYAAHQGRREQVSMVSV